MESQNYIRLRYVFNDVKVFKTVFLLFHNSMMNDSDYLSITDIRVQIMPTDDAESGRIWEDSNVGSGFYEVDFKTSSVDVIIYNTDTTASKIVHLAGIHLYSTANYI